MRSHVGNMGMVHGLRDAGNASAYNAHWFDPSSIISDDHC
jgi:hypothetical protein